MKQQKTNNWQIKKLGEVCKTTSGGTPSRKNKNYYSGTIPWVKSGELDRGIIFDTEEKITEEAIKNSSAKIFPKGTLLIALYGATIGKLAFLGVDATTNQAVCGIYENENIISKYLYYFLLFNKPKLVQQGVGGAQPNISQTILKDLDLPLPPLETQHAIVSKIEELFSELDKGIAELKTAQQQLKTYRQSVLKSAFEGKLTNDNVKEGELPDGWEMKKLLNETYLITKGASPKWQGINYTNDSDQVLFITSENVRENFIDITNPKYLELSFNEKQKRSILKSGDILINIVGASIGRASLFNLEVNANINQAVCVVRLKEHIFNKYLSYFLNSNKALSYYIKNKVDVARANLSLADIGNIEFNCPSTLEEQHLIVQEIESRLSVADKMEQSIQESLQKAEALRQSILKKAFCGELV